MNVLETGKVPSESTFTQTQLQPKSDNYHNGGGTSSSAVEDFIGGLERARAVFGTTHKMDATRMHQWHQFYDEKCRLHEVLCIALPQVARIPEFWRTAQYLGGSQLASWILGQLRTPKLTQCECGTPLTRNGKWCEACTRERKIQLTIEARHRRKVNARAKRCQCGVLLKKRHRFCGACAKARRRESYRRAKTESKGNS